MQSSLTQYIPPWIREHPVIALGAGGVLPVILFLLSIPGMIDDSSVWKTWITSELFRITLVILGFSMIVYCLFVPVIWGALGIRNPFSRKMPIDIQVKHGSGFPPSMQNAIAQLLILNQGNMPLEKCAIRVINAIPLRNGTIQRSPNFWPSVLEARNESFQLRWSKDEVAAHGEAKQWLDLPSDGSWHSSDVAEYGSDQADSIVFCPLKAESVNSDYPGSNWWKLEIRIACEAEWYKPREIELVFGFEPRDGIPGPILLDWWEPRGQRVVDSQLEKIKKEQQRANEKAINQENKIEDSETSRD